MDNDENLTCSTCNGSGELTSNPTSHPAWETSTECPACGGTGEFTQCSNNVGGDPVSGCDNEAVESGLCSKHLDTTNYGQGDWS